MATGGQISCDEEIESTGLCDQLELLKKKKVL